MCVDWAGGFSFIHTVAYHHCEPLLEEFVALKAADYVKYQKKMKKLCGTVLLILDDFLLHTLTGERAALPLIERTTIMDKTGGICHVSFLSS